MPLNPGISTPRPADYKSEAAPRTGFRAPCWPHKPSLPGAMVVDTCWAPNPPHPPSTPPGPDAPPYSLPGDIKIVRWIA